MTKIYRIVFTNKEEWHSLRTLELQKKLLLEQFGIDLVTEPATICPCHDDKVPSLKYYINPSGVVKFVCKAGCFNQDIYGMVGMRRNCSFPKAYSVVDEFMKRERGLAN